MPQLKVTQVGAYADYNHTGYNITQVGAYVAYGVAFVRITQVGGYVCFTLPPPPLDAFSQQRRITMGARAHKILPQEETGYQLDDSGTFWHIIAPEGSENLIINPSFEAGTLGYTYTGWTSADANNSNGLFGMNSLKLKLVGMDGFVKYALPLDVVEGDLYTFSVYVYAYPDMKVNLQLRSGLDAVLHSASYVVQQRGWARFSLTFPMPAVGSQVLGLNIQPAFSDAALYSSSTEYVYTDGWQLERKAYPTSYFDGSFRSLQEDPNPFAYAWRGLAHQSRSVRAATTPNGGRVVPLSLWEFKTTGHQGLGFIQVGVENYGIKPLDDLLKRFTTEERTFILNGRIYGRDLQRLSELRAGLIDLLRPVLVGPAMRKVLVYQPVDRDGVPYGIPLSISCVFTDGLQGQINNLYAETLSLTFKTADPRWYEDRWVYQTADSGGTGAETLILLRDENGDYTQGGSSTTDGRVRAVAFDHDGELVIGGDFGLANGISAASIARFDGVDWYEVGNGTNGVIYSLATALDVGSYPIAVGGTFTLDGLSNPITRAAVYDKDNNALVMMATGLNGTPFAIVPSGYGDFYLGGNFTNDGTGFGGPFNFVVKYDAHNDAWVNLGDGVDDDVFALCISPDNQYLYVGGTFTQIDSVSPTTAYRVARLNLTTGDWSAVGSGFNSDVNALAFGPDNMLYAGGAFTQDGLNNYDLRRIARWNGYTWEEVGGGLDNIVHTLQRDGNRLLVAGMFGNTAGMPPHVGKNVAYWTGNQWVKAEFDSKYVSISGAPYAEGAALARDGRLALGLGTIDTSDLIMAGSTTVVNPGTAEVAPVIIVPAGHNLYFIRNLTTGQAIYFKNFSTFRSEDAYLDLRGVQPRFYSTQRVNLLPFIDATTSNLDFALVAGENIIQILCENWLQPIFSGTVTFSYRPAHWSFDNAG